MTLGYDSTGFVYGFGQQAMMLYLLEGRTVNVGLLRLNCSSVPITPSDTGTFAYINPANPSTPAIDLSSLTPTVSFNGSSSSISYGDLTFTLFPSAHAPTVYSWFIGLSGPFELWWGGNLPIPYAIPGLGGTLVFDNLTITMGACGQGLPFVLDTFTGSDSTALTAHPMNSGTGWIAVIGTFWIQTDHATGHSNADNDQVVTDGGFTSFELLCDVTPFWTDSSNFDHTGVVFRWSSPTDFWLLDTDGDGSLVRLVKVQGGAFSVPAQSTQSIPSGSTHTIGCQCSGDSITVTWDGASLFTVVAGFNQYETRAGFRVGKAGSPPAQGYWDNFRLNFMP